MSRTMTAYRLTGWQRPPAYQQVPVPVPTPGEVLVKTAGVGLCHSDTMLLQLPAGVLPYELPFTLGHENAGWVAEVGDGVTGVAPGDPVVVSSPSVCGSCRFCLRGYTNYCVTGITGRGFGRDGGLAEYMLVASAGELVQLDGLDPRRAGPLTDAGTTPYHAVRRVLPKLVPGSTAIVIGAGGLGGYAVQYLRVLSPARVIAVDTAQHRLDYARELGAHETVLSTERVGADLAELTGGAGAEVVLDFVGADATMATALAASRRLGALGLIGASGGTLPVTWMTLPAECELFTTQGGTLSDLHEVVALAEAGTIRVDVDLFTFDQVAEAYAALAAGTVRSRAVVTV